MSKSFTRSAQLPGQNGLARVALSIALVEERGPFLAYVSFKGSNSATEEESPNGDASSKKSICSPGTDSLGGSRIKEAFEGKASSYGDFLKIILVLVRLCLEG